MDEFEKRERHESYGMVGFSRYTSSGGQNFFGSAIKSATGIELTIKKASRYRHLNNDWIHGEEEIVSVQLSPNQFADLITCMNQGDGVPCTISTINGKRMADPPETHIRAQFDAEFEKDVKDTVVRSEQNLKELKTLLEKPSLGKKDREQIFKMASDIIGHVKGGMPFIQQQFNEAMDKVVTAARAEVEAFMEQKIRSLGIQKLQDDAQKALGPVASSPALLDAEVKDSSTPPTRGGDCS